MEIKQRVDKEYLIQLLNSYNVNLLSSAFDQLGILFTYQTISQAFFVFHCTMEFIAVEHKSTIQEKKMQYDLEKIIFSYSKFTSMEIKQRVDKEYLIQLLNSYNVNLLSSAFDQLGILFTYQTISQAFFVFHCTMEFIAVEHKSTIQEKKMQYDLEKIIFSYSSYISFLIILELKFQHGLLQ